MTSTMNKIAFLIPWFGRWPDWIDLFFKSASYNPDVDWIIFTDNECYSPLYQNIVLNRLSFAEYRDLLASRLGLSARWQTSYKLCDLKPTFGYVHNELIRDYDYWAFGDMDVIYGQIRKILNPDFFRFDLVSTHLDRVSGHFALIKNNERMNLAFTKIPFWKKMLSEDKHYGFDEGYFSRLFVAKWRSNPLRRIFSPHFLGGGLFEEQFSTGLPSRKWVDGSSNWPSQWRWKAGTLTNNLTANREFLYLHFTNWHSDRWMKGKPAAWRKLGSLVDFDPSEVNEFYIGEDGFSRFKDQSVWRE